VLAGELDSLALAPDAVICMVVRGTVPNAARPVLASLGLESYLIEPDGLPFPGRWSGHRQRFIASLRAAAARYQVP
jgi:hypothetical protein